MNSPDSPPLVSIQTLVYNHEPFLRECLEGIVTQQTDFPFEAIVHDDASTDKSAAIIREYAEKYPHIIKPIYQKENQYSKKNGGIRRAIAAVISPHSLYRAYCEGDDFWTSPHKLQKQIDFMRVHPEYSMCFHNATVKYGVEETDEQTFSNIENRDYSGEEIFDRWIVPTASVLIRHDVLKTQLYKDAVQCPHFAYGDILVFLTAASCGRVRGMSDSMSVYRRHTQGMSMKAYHSNRKKHIIHNYWIGKIFGHRYSKLCKKHAVGAAFISIRAQIKAGKYRCAAELLILTLRHSPLALFNQFYRAIWAKIQKHSLREHSDDSFNYSK